MPVYELGWIRWRSSTSATLANDYIVTCTSSLTATTFAIDYFCYDNGRYMSQNVAPVYPWGGGGNPPVPVPSPEAPAIITAPRTRALTLLMDHLSAEQRRQMELEDYFDVKVNSRTYRIRAGWSGNVKLLNAFDEAVESLCIHFGELLPVADLMLAQKLMLETDEVAFRRIANITSLTSLR